jgi:alpha,alpha-trehalase
MKQDRILTRLLLVVMAAAGGSSLAGAKTVTVDSERVIRQLLQEEDTDDDKKITVDDFWIRDTNRGDRRFCFKGLLGEQYGVNGTYYLANLLQELTLAQEAEKGTALIQTERIFENPVHRISRMIRDYYWDGLTRRIDAQSLIEALKDNKIRQNHTCYLYVPHDDAFAFDYFSDAAQNLTAINLKVIYLPETIAPEYVKGLEGKHGLLPLALRKTAAGGVEGVPFVVPGGRFNEMYGWDSYFEALGLIADGKIDLAKAMTDNFVYQIDHYGKILNANRTYYLTRSQPPFLTSMALAIYEKLPANNDSKQWLKIALLAAIKEYNDVWMNKDHLTGTGLSRYYGTGLGIPPEVEEGHFDPILKPFAKKYGLSTAEFQRQYQRGILKEPELDTFFRHDRAVRESGHDTTYRWRIDGKDRCGDFVTVDLNALLYKYELDIAFMLKNIFDDNIEGHSVKDWYARAEKRKQLILTYLWDADKHLFFDFHLPSRKRSDYISATTFYPLWACYPGRPETKILTSEQAEKFVTAALSYLESSGGILSGAKSSIEQFGDPNHLRQWDFPNGWPPHQMLIWQGLRNYGYDTHADRLIYKWLYMITANAADYNGTIPEKFDVVNRSHAVFAEYGNVGTDFAYITKEGFGWMNASYQIGLMKLSQKWKNNLEDLIPPEWIDFE